MNFETFISFGLTIAAIYLLIGALFAIPFVFIGVKRIDEGAAQAGWGFRLIIIPGTILLWPILLKKWITNKTISHDART